MLSPSMIQVLKSNGFPFRGFDQMLNKAFTIVELMVSIGIIALLVALMLPSLSGARTKALEVKAMSQLKNLGVTLEVYLQDNKSIFPWHPPGVPYNYSPPDFPSTGDLTSSEDPWTLKNFWPTTLHRVAPWTEYYESWLGANPQELDSGVPWQNSEGLANFSPYQYSNSFVGDPACWLALGPARPRPVRQYEVRFPSSKALMFDLGRNYLPQVRRSISPRAVLAADSSTAMRQDEDAQIPTQNRARQSSGAQIYHDTPGGVFGRDF